MINKIPLRPSNDAKFQIPKLDKQIIITAVLLQLDNQSAYALYHPELTYATGKLNDTGKQESRHFWSYGRHKEYRLAYEDTLNSFMGHSSAKNNVTDELIDDSRKDNALKLLLNQAMQMVEANYQLDADTLKVVTDIFRKLNILKDDEVQEEAPRRYLAVCCQRECQYRSFMETHLQNGDIISDCDYCKTRAFAESHGWKYNPTHNLDLPVDETGALIIQT